MSAMEYFLLGVMVSWTPSLIVLAWLVRPALNLDRLRKPIGLLEIPPTKWSRWPPPRPGTLQILCHREKSTIPRSSC